MICRWLDSIHFLPEFIILPLYSILSGKSPLEHHWIAALAFYVPILTSSFSFSFLFIKLFRKSDAGETVRQLLRWGVIFAVITFFMAPIFTQDLWYSVAWGRMASQGDNPYYTVLTPYSLEGQPLVFSHLKMTYGPLWCIVCSWIAWIAHENVFIEFIIHKLILLSTWIIALRSVAGIARIIPKTNVALAVCCFGWMPMSTILSIGEAHNDIVMVSLVMIWMFLLLSNRHRLTSFFLTASILIKYITLPLFIVEFSAAWKKQWISKKSFWASFTIACLMAIYIITLFARDLRFLDPILSMQKWPPIFSPSAALMKASDLVGSPMSYRLAWWIVFIPCLGILSRTVIPYFKSGKDMVLINMIISVLATVLLTSVGHIWPWFLIWILGPSALKPDTPVSLFIIILCLLGPFLAFSFFWNQYSASLVYYITAFFLTVIIRWRLPSSEIVLNNKCKFRLRSLNDI
ncbi:hypothetical protein JW824_13860 [bacterium]|nr:hypothetical protein [bacterium]